MGFNPNQSQMLMYDHLCAVPEHLCPHVSSHSLGPVTAQACPGHVKLGDLDHSRRNSVVPLVASG
jgi:hypothetical protein